MRKSLQYTPMLTYPSGLEVSISIGVFIHINNLNVAGAGTHMYSLASAFTARQCGKYQITMCWHIKTTTEW